MQTFTISGQLIDLHQRRTYGAEVTVTNGRIAAIRETDDAEAVFLLPGFVDAHIHIESSMVVPTSFAIAAVAHGTVATVSDPHEIANVCGVAGVRFMIENSRLSPFKFFFGAPSCVPATTFENAGAQLGVDAVDELLQSPDIWYLSEMMNYPGVLHNDPDVMAKIALAKKYGKPVDGHAPGLRGTQAAQYAAAGITTDHECVSLEEALDKIAVGMRILIREGSAAKNYDALHPLLQQHPDAVMFCSDDKHPDELLEGHINLLVKRSLANGYDLYDVLKAACLNPVNHYGLPVGLLRMGDPADFIVIDNLDSFQIQQTYIDGNLLYDGGCNKLEHTEVKAINSFHATRIQPASLAFAAPAGIQQIRVIVAMEGQLITEETFETPLVHDGHIISDTVNDILKIVVINRYTPQAKPAVAFIKNFGLKHGAIASTIAHDCHNIIAVGADDESMTTAINALIDAHGGISVAVSTDEVYVLPLSVGGLMSINSLEHVAEQYTELDRRAKELGTRLQAPFMTLSFMALLVIPTLKLSDLGLFDGRSFQFVDVVSE